MKITKIWFEDDHIYGLGDDGKEYRQSLLWYKNLRNATEQQRNEFEMSPEGIHWPTLDEDISFESFEYDDAEPSKLQRFFLTHPEINIGEFAKRIGMNASLLRNYINGFKKPSKERESAILQSIHKIGAEYCAVNF